MSTVNSRRCHSDSLLTSFPEIFRRRAEASLASPSATGHWGTCPLELEHVHQFANFYLHYMSILQYSGSEHHIFSRCSHRFTVAVVYLVRQSRITSALQQLHWLPDKFRIVFKNATLVHQILHNRCPSYLTDLVEFNTADSQRRQLRSSLTRAAVVKRTRTHFGKRAFSVCGPHTWNSLPPAVRNIDSYPAFRRALKSQLFQFTFIKQLFTVTYFITGQRYVVLSIVMHSRPSLHEHFYSCHYYYYHRHHYQMQ